MVTEAERGLLVRTNATAGELIEAWFEQATRDLSPKTIKETRGFIDRNLLPAIGTVPLSRLKASDLDRLYPVPISDSDASEQASRPAARAPDAGSRQPKSARSRRRSQKRAPRSPQTDGTTSGRVTVPTIRVDRAGGTPRPHLQTRSATQSPPSDVRWSQIGRTSRRHDPGPARHEQCVPPHSADRCTRDREHRKRHTRRDRD
jgi:hypothetical protein